MKANETVAAQLFQLYNSGATSIQQISDKTGIPVDRVAMRIVAYADYINQQVDESIRTLASSGNSTMPHTHAHG